jgi:hypothetical protein
VIFAGIGAPIAADPVGTAVNRFAAWRSDVATQMGIIIAPSVVFIVLVLALTADTVFRIAREPSRNRRVDRSALPRPLPPDVAATQPGGCAFP